MLSAIVMTTASPRQPATATRFPPTCRSEPVSTCPISQPQQAVKHNVDIPKTC